ncbi:hypothetical protein BGZ97_009468 [Linnemannia gamsii]|jgi:NAD(P)-dependent dehydrogenase (short-subunit alcohol dehydrogenase family)|uniref:NAD(P)-binding protein n=1 Tax=Linnemannia gamsii TaxID=64522 RepID=A0A9P6RBQ8_9FUNG|nr:hypothetical protein BGZ97_009468 [Linnemannia gamsii]
MPVCNVFTNPKFWKTFFLENQYAYDQIPDLTGKVAIVTGATGGLGYATVVALAAHGAHVFLACRSRDRAEAAIQKAQADILQLQFDHPDGHYPSSTSSASTAEKGLTQTQSYPFQSSTFKPKLDFLELELGQMDKARSAAEAFLAKGLPLHILVCNGGIKNRSFELTTDGYENHFGINHLGHFVFTTTLLDRIRQSGPARIVVLASFAHEMPSSSNPIPFELLRNPTTNQATLIRYGQSKLANVLFAKALARRLAGDKVWVNIAHPGCTDAQIHTAVEEMKDSRCFYAFSRLWLKTSYPVKEAALTQLFCATAKEVEEKDLRGRYFIPVANEMRPNPVSDNVALQEELWTFSEQAARGEHGSM